MANLVIVGSHSTNGVAAIHSELLRKNTVKDLAEMFPERFNNKTNGVTPRRWLRLANPSLGANNHRQDRRIIDFQSGRIETNLRRWRLIEALANRFREAKRQAKSSLQTGSKRPLRQIVDPDTLFDCQIKRIHEYKRQLLNALRNYRVLQPTT